MAATDASGTPAVETRKGSTLAAGTFSAARAERMAVMAAMATSMPPGGSSAPASGQGAVTRPTASP